MLFLQHFFKHHLLVVFVMGCSVFTVGWQLEFYILSHGMHGAES